MKKKILIFICGNLKFFDEDNYYRLKNSLKDFEIEFILFPWAKEKKETIKKFKVIYKPIQIKKINKKNFTHKLKNIKFPDYAVNTENFFHMWHGLIQSYKYIEKFISSKKWKPNYVLKYRSDILPKKNQDFILSSKLKKNSILLPDRYHWHGLNDQIFLIRLDDIKVFNKFNAYVDYHIKNKFFFCNEYIFSEFLKKKKFKIIYNKFDYNIMRISSKKNLNNAVTAIPFKDKLNIKINKFKFIFRNLYDFYILKNNRNKLQDIIIKK